MSSIHARIKERRRALKLSQEKLGEMVGVSYQTVQQWEREPGRSEDGSKVLSTAPSRKRLQQVAAILGVTPQWLLTGENDDGQKTDPTEEQLLMFYRSVNEESKAAMLTQANALFNALNPGRRSVANPFPNAPKKKRVP